MPLFSPASPVLERPTVVTAIVLLCAITSLVSLTLAVLIALGSVPLSTGAFLLGGGTEQMGPIVFLLYGAILAGLSVALWKRWKGARRVAITVAAAGVALSVPAVSSAVVDGRLLAILRDGFGIILRVVVIYSLSQEPVKEWFFSVKPSDQF